MPQRAIIAPPPNGRGPALRVLSVQLPQPSALDPSTDAQVYATLAIMRALVQDAPRWPAVVRLMRRCSAAANPMQQVYQEMKRVTFQADPRRAEVVRHPELMARELEQTGTTRGDCDDRATLGASILAMLGTRPVFVVMSRSPRGNFEHVFFGVRTDNRRTAPRPAQVVPMDPQERTPFGHWTPPLPTGGRMHIEDAT